MLARREFIRMGAVAVAQSLCPAVNFALREEGATGELKDKLTSTAFIWSSETISVPLMHGGSADGIAASSHAADTRAAADLHSVFRRLFSVTGGVSFARIHIVAFTRYRLYINGSYVGRGPCRYQNQWPEYDTRDIRALLRDGENSITVLVHRDAPTGRIMLHEPGIAAVVEWADRKSQHTMATDESWLSAPELTFGSRSQAWASIEEHIDARKMPDWLSNDADFSRWKPSVRVPVAEQITIHPRNTPLQMEQDCQIEDRAFPIALRVDQEISLPIREIVQGFHALHLEAEEGSLLELVYELPDSQVSGRCTYICRNGVQVYIGGDTFALRSLKIRLLNGKVTLKGAAITEMRYPFERAASFECSDPFHNKLWSICARSLEVLSEDAYVDCADRERVEWTDCSPPAFDCTRVMMRGPDTQGRAFWGDSRLLQSLLRRISLTQQPDGQMKAHSCSERFDIHAIMEDRTCDWVVLLREYYESSGDAKFVREMWPALLGLLRWYRDRETENGLVLAREWEVWDNPLRYVACEGTGLNAMYYRALCDARYLASVIDSVNDQKELKIQLDQLSEAFNRLLWDDSAAAYCGALIGTKTKLPSKSAQQLQSEIIDGRYKPTAQANLFALYAGIVPEHRIAATRAWILSHLDQIREPMSHYYLFRMLYAMEIPEHDLKALELIKAGWKNQVESSWGTTWEELEAGGGSKVHVYGMVPGYYLSAHILGTRRVGDHSDRTIRIEPRTSGMTFARGACVTEFGLVKVRWERKASGDFALSCELPANVKAKLRLYREEGRSLYVNRHKVIVSDEGPFITVLLKNRNNQISYQSP